MIHILLLILKIIGIILLSVIGLLLLAVLSVLFVPVRYKAKGDYHKEFTGKLHIGWFLNALRLDASFDKELKARARVLFFTLYDSDKNKDEAKAGKSYNTSDTHSSGDKNRNKDKEKNVFDDMKDETAGGDIAVSEAGSVKRSWHEGDTQRTEKPVEKKNEAEAGKTSDKKNVGQTEGAECVGNAEKPPSEVKKAENATSVIVNKVNGETGANSDGKISEKQPDITSAKKTPGIIARLKKRIYSLTDKVKSIIKKTKRKIRAVIRSKDKLKKKIDDIKMIINDEANKEMVRLLYSQLKALFKEIMPVKYKINIHYGCDDPYRTGQLLMYISVFYGLSGINMNITPDFNEKILEGDIYIKGRVRIYKLLMIVFRVYRNKRFRELVLNK
uniref:DUF2953 domain-containing protein n=1 Tax=Lachnospira sp. TaxID=2049031 RepID=UPI003FF1420D